MTPSLDRIKKLRELALSLEPEAEQRNRWLEQVILYTDEFMDSIPNRPAVVTTEDKDIGILDSPISEEPIPIKQALDLLKNHVDYP